MAKRKIEAMHGMFGVGDGRCADCRHLERHGKGGREVLKCAVYGNTGSEASDWRKNWLACGLLDGERPGDIPVIEVLRHEGRKKGDAAMEGQMSLFGAVE